MRAELRWVDPNDYPNWDAFAAAERDEPWDDFRWFALGIGPAGEEGTDNFQVLVATPTAASRAQGDESRFKGIIVEVFEPDIILETLREYVFAATGNSWCQIVDQLRPSMQ